MVRATTKQKTTVAIDDNNTNVTPRQVDDYGKICSELKVLEQRKESLRTLLLTAYTTGQLIPTGDCCIIDFLRTTRHNIDWKQQAIDLAKLIHGDSWTAWVVEVENKSPTSEIIRVVPKPIAGVAKAS